MTVGPVRRDRATGEFFDAAARGEFLLRRCRDCGSAAEPAVAACPACGSQNLDWAPASGQASLVSWTVVPDPAGPGEVAAGQPARVVLAIGELAEGPWWWARLAGADPAALRVGAPLRIAFERAGEHEPVPVFRLA